MHFDNKQNRSIYESENSRSKQTISLRRMKSPKEDGLLSLIPLINKSVRYPLNTTTHREENLSHGQSLLIVFESVRITCCICSVLGILGNIGLIYVICNTSFRHVSYGLLIATIALFDSIRLLSSIFYYLLFANVIPANSTSKIIYIAIDRYPIFVVNWCKVRKFDLKKR